MTDQIMDIDGSVLEGGGQILRISISLSAILRVPVRVSNIRAGRSKPGLAAQHLKGIQLVADMCQAKLKGASIGSTEIEFIPKTIRGGHYCADTQTAGSISLLLQVALPCALMADSPVTIDMKGGTNADMAPQIDYMDIVFKNILRKFGADFSLNILRRGYYPKGGGHVRVEITPVRRLDSMRLTERGPVTKVAGTSFVAGTLPIRMAHQMAEGAKHVLSQHHSPVDVRCYKEDRSHAPDNCAGIIVWCELSPGVILGGDALCRRGQAGEAAGRQAADLVAAALASGACLDAHAQDQVILYMALADGTSTVRVSELTLHTKTAIHIAEMIAKTKFEVTQDGDQMLIKCTGLGLINKNVSN